MRFAALFLALMFPATSQMPMGGITANVAACTAPSATLRMTAWEAGNTCTTSCSNGNTITTLKDQIGSNNATAGTSHAFIYDTSASVNGLATLLAGGANVVQQALTTGLPQSGTMTYYVVVKPSSTCANGTNNCVAFGQSAGLHSVNLAFFNNSGLKSLSQVTGVGVISFGTTTVSTAAFSTVVMEYTFATGALAWYRCSGGSCTADGTATSGTTTYTGTINWLGDDGFANDQFIGNLGELGYFNSISSSNRTQIAAWSQCKYGI